MQRLKACFIWGRNGVCAIAVLALILAVAFWDTVVLGRSIDQQLERSDR